MALIDKDQVKAEIERRLSWRITLEARAAYNNILRFLDTLPEQPKLKPMNIPSGGGAMGTTPPKFKLKVEKQPVEEPEYYQHFDPDC